MDCFTNDDEVVVVVETRSANEITEGEVIQFAIASITNPSTTAPTGLFVFRLADANEYLINSYSGDTTMSTSESSTYEAPSMSTSSIVQGIRIEIEIGALTVSEMPSDGYFVITYPA